MCVRACWCIKKKDGRYLWHELTLTSPDRCIHQTMHDSLEQQKYQQLQIPAPFVCHPLRKPFEDAVHILAQWTPTCFACTPIFSQTCEALFANLLGKKTPIFYLASMSSWVCPTGSLVKRISLTIRSATSSSQTAKKNWFVFSEPPSTCQ